MRADIVAERPRALRRLGILQHGATLKKYSDKYVNVILYQSYDRFGNPLVYPWLFLYRNIPQKRFFTVDPAGAELRWGSSNGSISRSGKQLSAE